MPNVGVTLAGEVSAIAVQSDNQIILGGSFTTVNGVPRADLARLNANGSLDGIWNPGLNAAPTALAVYGPDIYVGLTNTPGLFKLNTIDSSQAQPVPVWNTNKVYVLALQGSTLFLGGAGFLGKMTLPAGDNRFAWPVTGDVRALAVDATNLYVGGSFSSIAFSNRNGLARINLPGTGTVDAWNPGVVGRVSALTLGGNALYVGGAFTSIAGQPRNTLAKLPTSGTNLVDLDWRPEPNGTNIDALLFQDAGVFVAGPFTQIGGGHRTNLAKLHTDGLGQAFDGWKANPDQYWAGVSALVIQGNDVLLGNRFTRIGGVGGFISFAKLSGETGLPDESVHVSVGHPGKVGRLIRQPDEKIIVLGQFDSIGNLTRSGIARLNRDGTIDESWDPNPNGPVFCAAAQGADVFVGGNFTFIGGQARSGLAKVRAAGGGAADPDWNTNGVARTVYYLAVGGKSVYAAGPDFDLEKLSTSGDGTADPSWGTDTNWLPSFFFDAFGPGIWGRDRSETYNFLAADQANLFLAPEDGVMGQPPHFAQLVKIGAEPPGYVDWNWQTNESELIVALTLMGSNVFFAEFDSLQKHDRFVKAAKSGSGTSEPLWDPLKGTGFAGKGFFDYNLSVSASNIYFFATSNSLAAIARASTMGTGAINHLWQVDGAVHAIQASGNGAFVGGEFSSIGGQPRAGLGYIAVAESPILINRPGGNLAILRNPDNGSEVTYFQIVAIGGGTLTRSGTNVNVGDFISAEQAEAALNFLGTTNGAGMVKVLSSLNDTTSGTGTNSSMIDLSQPQAPVFTFSAGDYSVYESSNVIRVTVRKWGGPAASVDLATADGTALAYDYDADSGDYIPVETTLNFPAGETNKSFDVFILNDHVFTGDRTFWIALSNSEGGLLAYPATASITIMEDDPFGPTGSFTATNLPTLLDTNFGNLQIFVGPAEASGQWRLVGELFWRDSGELVGGLIPTNYAIEFKSVANYDYLFGVTLLVTAGQTKQFATNYTAIPVSQNGPVTVIVNPPSVATNAYPTNAASGTIFPRPLSFAEVTDTNSPYLYNGLLQTDIGSSSGFVVKERVVLTAAHTLFNDYTLQWVTGARWFFQKHTGSYQPVAQTPRGWYVLSGYAAQRTNDLTGPMPPANPGVSTSRSQQLDAAALYFIETDYSHNFAGRGGYGGYLASDSGALNEYLTSDSNKLLVGYPLVPDPLTRTNWGKMYATMPTNITFKPINQKVFRTSELLSYPGNSGGPLYVLWTNALYYPAAIYLGERSQTLVRVIDSAVVDLINRAEESGNDGRNFTGGGVITISPRYTSTNTALGYVLVDLGPEEAITVGGAWRVPNVVDWTTNRDYAIDLARVVGSFNIEFQCVPGWVFPLQDPIQVDPNAATTIHPRYRAGSYFTYRKDEGVRFFGAKGLSYQIQYSDDLTSTNWVSLTNLTLTDLTLTNCAVAIDSIQLTNSVRRFFRAVQVGP